MGKGSSTTKMRQRRARAKKKERHARKVKETVKARGR